MIQIQRGSDVLKMAQKGPSVVAEGGMLPHVRTASNGQINAPGGGAKMAEYAAVYRSVYEFQERWLPYPTLQDWEAFIDDANRVSKQHGGGPLIKKMLEGVILMYWEKSEAGD